MALERQHGAGLRPLLFYGRVGRGILHENYGDALRLAQGTNWEFWPRCRHAVLDCGQSFSSQIERRSVTSRYHGSDGNENGKKSNKFK